MSLAKIYYQSPVGCLEITADEQSVVELTICDKAGVSTGNENAVLVQCRKELDEFFDGKRQVFTISLAFQGSPFQQKVWRELQQIPYGETISYAQLAERIGHPKAYRAAGSANGKNPIPIIIPCHRVIASNGTLGGYAYGLEVKTKLLGIEKR